MSDLTPLSLDDYETIAAAVEETERGRWFLTEFARRNRVADTHAVLEAIAGLERRLPAPARPAPPQRPNLAPAVARATGALTRAVQYVQLARRETPDTPDEVRYANRVNRRLSDIERFVTAALQTLGAPAAETETPKTAAAESEAATATPTEAVAVIAPAPIVADAPSAVAETDRSGPESLTADAAASEAVAPLAADAADGGAASTGASQDVGSVTAAPEVEAATDIDAAAPQGENGTAAGRDRAMDMSRHDPDAETAIRNGETCRLETAEIMDRAARPEAPARSAEVVDWIDLTAFEHQIAESVRKHAERSDDGRHLSDAPRFASAATSSDLDDENERDAPRLNGHGAKAAHVNGHLNGSSDVEGSRCVNGSGLSDGAAGEPNQSVADIQPVADPRTPRSEGRLTLPNIRDPRLLEGLTEAEKAILFA